MVFLWKRGDHDAALADFNRLVEAQPKDPQAFENRGYVLFDKGKLAAALADFDKAISLNPRKAAFFASRGQVLQEMGDLERELAACDQAISLDPNFARGFYCRGTALYAKNDLSGAVAFGKTIELDANTAEAHGNLGWVLLRLGKEAEAEKEFAECIRLDPASEAKLEKRIREARLKRPRP